MHLVQPEMARGTITDVAGGSLCNHENTWGLSFPKENLEVGGKSQRKKQLQVNWEYQLSTQRPYRVAVTITTITSAVNKVLTADVIVGYARDFIHIFLKESCLLLTVGI